MNSDIKALAMISAGFRRGAEKLEEIRRKEIRDSDPVIAIPMFDELFEMAVENAEIRIPAPLSKAQRILFGIDQ